MRFTHHIHLQLTVCNSEEISNRLIQMHSLNAHCVNEPFVIQTSTSTYITIFNQLLSHVRALRLPVVMRNGVRDGVNPDVPHVKLARRVWKHAQDVKVGFPAFRLH